MSDFQTIPVKNSIGIPAFRASSTKKPQPAVRFTKVSDDDTEAYWQSNKLSNGDFDYWIVAQLMYLEDYELEGIEEKYAMQLLVVAPSKVPIERRDDYLSSLGLRDDEFDLADEGSEKETAFFLVESGCAVGVWAKYGNNKRELYTEAVAEAQGVQMLFGFYMDRPVNMIGTTGWDMLTGDIMAGLKGIGA